MSTEMKPNQLEVIQKATSEHTGVVIPESIKVAEAHLYHVVMINSIPKPPTGYKHEMKVQMFDRKSWEVNKKQLPRLGYSQTFILHDPIKHEADVKKAQAKAAGKTDEGAGSEGSGAPVVEPSYGFMKTEAKEMGYEGSQKKDALLAFFAEKEVSMESLVEKEKAAEEAGNE